MNRIDKVFKKLDEKKEKALIPYVSCGDPSLEFTEKLVLALAESGADMVELGVPYSDPVADGPVIQRASSRALAGGVTLEKIFSLAKSLRERTQIPLIMMTYYNPVYVIGVDRFVEQAVLSGIDGLIIPDLPLEEVLCLKKAADANDVNLIFLVAPTSTSERIKNIATLSRGFIYCVSIAGVTGTRQTTSSGLDNFLNRVRQHTELPLCVGFGISGPETARKSAQYSDGVIVGSSLIEKIEENMQKHPNDTDKAIDVASCFIKNIKEAITK